MTSDGKFSVRLIVEAHHGSLVDARTGTRSLRDYVTLYGAPLAAFGLFVGLGVDLRSSVGNLLAGVGLASAFLFGLVLQLYERATEWADGRPEPSAATSRYAALLEELTANAAYAAIVTAVATLGLVAYDVDIGLDRWLSLEWPRRVLAAAILAGLLHALLSMALVLRRVVLLTQERLRKARTGAELPERSGRPTRQAG